MSVHEFSYKEKILHNRFFEAMKEKQESHEDLAHAKIAKVENGTTEFFKKTVTIKLVDENKRPLSKQLKRLTLKMTFSKKEIEGLKKGRKEL